MQRPMIEALVDLALTAYLKRIQPSEYAKAAAHRAAKIEASKHHTEIADYAALTAAAAFYVEVTDAITFSARVTDAATRKLMSDSAYNAEWQEYSSTILPADTTQKHFFRSLAETPDKAIHDFSASVIPTIETIRVTDVAARNRAKRAAFHVYRDVYATARTSYVRAMYRAAHTPNEYQRQAVFIKYMRARLEKELSYDWLQPHFIWLFLRHIWTRVMAMLLFMAAMLIIVVGCLHVFSWPLLPVIGAACGAGFLSAGVLAGGFYAQKTIQRIDEQNARREDVSCFD